MELDSKIIKRLVGILLFRIQKNWRILSVRLIAFVYLFGTFFYMALFFSYYVRVADKPLGYFMILLIMVAAYLLYVVFNHLLVRLVISHRILLIYDLLALIMLVSIIISDGWAEKSLSVTIPAALEQDKTIRNSFSKTAKSEYDLIDNNCATAVQKAMVEAAIPVSEPTIVPSYTPMPSPFGIVDVFNGSQMKCDFNIVPSFAFKSIMQRNPSGTYIQQ